jgi:DNA-binding response OmpR family regulator
VDELREAQAAKAILSDKLFNVLTASSAEQALSVLESEDACKLVVSESLLPGGIAGISLIGRVRILYPATAVMLMTRSRDRRPDPEIPILVKPFTPSALIEKVEGLLAESRRIAESLTAAFGWNRAAKEELETIRQSLRQNIRQSRLRRSERFRSSLREPGALVPTILVAEDNAALRSEIRRFLAGCGFRILEAPDGAEALKSSRAYDGRIDLLLADLQMPEPGGMGLLETIELERPVTEIVAMSSSDIRLPWHTVRKPFELDDLLAEIVGVLARR